MQKKHILSLVLAGLLGSSLANAQPKAPTAFIAVACEQPINNIYYKLNGKDVPLKLPVFEGVGPLGCDSEGTLSFYRKEKNPAAGGEGGKVVAKVDLPGNSELNILLFHKAAKGGYDIKLFACNKDAFPAGQVRFINLSAAIAAFKLNEQVVTLQPNESKIVPATNGFVKYAVAVPAANGWAEAINGFSGVNDKSRLTVFITDSQSEAFTSEAAPGIFLEKTRVNCFQVRH